MVNDNPKFILDFVKPDILKKRSRQRKVFEFPGTFFISGNNKSFIYADANDKHYFLTLLSELQNIQDFSLLFHVLMDNHYHLALQTGTSPDSAPINQVMHQLNMTYSRYYNKLYSRGNTIYGGRYTSKLILDDQHFYRLLRYLAYNPVSAGMVSYPAEYRWSSHAAIRNDLPTPVNKQKILSYFGKDYNQARKRYTPITEMQRGYHYLMHLAHLFNVLACYSVSLVEKVKIYGIRGFIKFIRETLSAPWLDPVVVRKLLSRPFQLRLV